MNRIAALLVVLGLSTTPHTVTIEGGRRVLKSASGYQTVSMLDGGRTGLYYDSGELIGKLRPNAHDVVLLGLGGGEMLRAVRRTLPKAHLVGVEKDPDTATAAFYTFGMRELGVNVVSANAIELAYGYLPKAQGGSSFLIPAPEYDAVLVDLYEDSEMVPASTRRLFFAACARALRPGGILLMNVYPASRYAEVAAEAVGADFTVWRDDTWAPNAMLVGTKPY